MKALVTGASGFVGSTLIEELGTLGFDVHALMRKTSSPKNLEGLKYRPIEGDLSDVGALKRAVSEVDYVFHLAGATSAPNRAAFFESNAEGTRRVALAVAEARPGLSRFVYVSSLAAGGPAVAADQPSVESAEARPVSAYGQSKLAGERALLEYQNTFPISIVRPPIVYGPRDKAFFTLIQTVARNLMPIMQGSGGHKYYSAIHAKDLCRGIVQAAVAPVSQVPSGEVFYLSGEGFHTFQEVLSTIAEQLNCDPYRFKVPKVVLAALATALSAAGWATRRTFPLNLDKLNEMLPDYWICSTEKASRMLGFRPELSLSDGMRDAIEWYRREKWL
jgi:dihydroflavonol-4-reductase